MKHLLIAALAFTSSLSYGSHTVCSSPTLYYSSVRHDFGTQPPPGMELGKLTIVHNGKLLVEETHVQGQGGFTIPEFEVSFIGPQEVLSTTGVPVSGSRVYRDVAVLSTAPPSVVQEIERTAVVCEETWAFVP